MDITEYKFGQSFSCTQFESPCELELIDNYRSSKHLIFHIKEGVMPGNLSMLYIIGEFQANEMLKAGTLTPKSS